MKRPADRLALIDTPEGRLAVVDVFRTARQRRLAAEQATDTQADRPAA